jgi:hypothetical protein
VSTIAVSSSIARRLDLGDVIAGWMVVAAWTVGPAVMGRRVPIAAIPSASER